MKQALSSMVFTLFFTLLCAQSHGFQCQILLEPITDDYSLLERAVPEHTLSKNLTAQQRKDLKAIITRIKRSSRDFEKSYDKILSPYSPSFLPRLRAKLREIFLDFQENNKRITDQLDWFLREKGDLKFIDLGLSEHLTLAKKSIAPAFINNPQSVYFGLEYYVDSIYTEKKSRKEQFVQRPGYLWDTSLSRSYDSSQGLINIAKTLNSHIEVVKNPSDYDLYPFTDIPVSTSILKDGLPFSGLPLSDIILSFLNKNGDVSGHLQVGHQHFHCEHADLTNKFLKSKIKVITNLEPRWFTTENSSFPNLFAKRVTTLHRYRLLNSKGQEVNSLANISEYYFAENGVFMIPTLPARVVKNTAKKIEPIDSQSKMNSLVNIVTGATEPDYLRVSETVEELEKSKLVAPTHQEFLIALLELIYMNYKL